MSPCYAARHTTYTISAPDEFVAALYRLHCLNPYRRFADTSVQVHGRFTSGIGVARARMCYGPTSCCGPAVPYNIHYRSIYRVHGRDSGGTAQSDPQESPDNSSPRTVQHHAEATPFPLGACVPGILQATDLSHRRDQIFPLSLQLRASGSIPSVARPGQRYGKAMAPPAVSLRRPHELGVAQLPLGQSCLLANAAPSATARILAQPMSG